MKKQVDYEKVINRCVKVLYEIRSLSKELDCMYDWTLAKATLRDLRNMLVLAEKEKMMKGGDER